MAGTGEGESFSASSASQGGTVSVAFDASQLAYDLTGNQTEIEITSQQLPFPISLEMAETALKLAMPVARSEEPQDFAFGLTLRDFVMSDMIWGMFAPAGTSPRFPAPTSPPKSPRTSMPGYMGHCPGSKFNSRRLCFSR